MNQGVKMEMPSQVSSHDGASAVNGEQRPNEHVKRPMNAFMVWAKTERRQLAMRLPGMPNSEVSKILGDMWRRLPDEQKEKFRSESESIRRKHKQEHPDYRYHPNRHSRKTKMLDANSPVATSLIASSKQPQQRSLTPTVCNSRLMGVKDDSHTRPNSAPPSCHQQDLHSFAANPSPWWSPASTPPTSTFAAPLSNRSLNQQPPVLHPHTQFQSRPMPNSPSTVATDISAQMQTSPSSAWMQNSPADSHHSANSSQKRASPCLLSEQPRRIESPLVASAGSTRLNSSLNGSNPSIGMPATGGSLFPAVSASQYSYLQQAQQQQDHQSITAVSRYPGMAAMSTPKSASPSHGSANFENGSVPVVTSNDQTLAPSTLFYPYQPTAYHLPQAAYGWLDNRTFVVPEQIAANNTQHGQIYQQSVAS